MVAGTVGTARSVGPEQDRSWSSRRRTAWWVKRAVAVAGAIVTFAAAARIMGLSVDVQTKTASAAEHQALKDELRKENTEAHARIETAITGLSSRIDDVLTALVQARGERRGGGR